MTLISRYLVLTEDEVRESESSVNKDELGAIKPPDKLTVITILERLGVAYNERLKQCNICFV